MGCLAESQDGIDEDRQKRGIESYSGEELSRVGRIREYIYQVVRLGRRTGNYK